MKSEIITKLIMILCLFGTGAMAAGITIGEMILMEASILVGYCTFWIGNKNLLKNNE